MTTNPAPQKPLEIGLKKSLSVEPELDSDGDLELILETECDYSNHYTFLSPADQIALRDHLDRLIGDKK